MITKFELSAAHGRVEAIMYVWLYEPLSGEACTELSIRFDKRGIFADAARTLNIPLPTFSRDEAVAADEWLEDYVLRVDHLLQSNPDIIPSASDTPITTKETSHD